ncbi:USP6 N-terminal-like protein isoform X1 [Cimex lectularius]|uniref:Rab-GAP TBC domain-containing protein n=1 Tax=Cimex lectularius TaxID=79782 RepID=A0A8I6RIS0_CIMLE|nr:USP6 N-terminal-like protein isoform X1 [Cimex lectularius]
MNEEELVQRAADERAAIVAKYRLGRRDGAKIDSWEEPTFEIYHVLDRYGFIHDRNKHYSDERITESAGPAEIKIEREREKKWLKMLSQWNLVSGTEKLKRRVFKGIPNSLRGKAWMQILNLENLRKDQHGKYQEMRELAWKWSPDIRQIDLDVNRTYRDHIMFRERYNSKQQELFNVLGAYSMYNLEIGYCQGMSQIAALLLMYLDEEDAFWALSILVSDKRYNMHGFFIPGFPKLLRYQEHHDKIMHKFLPKLKKHLDKNGVDTGIYTLKWFFQCFLDRIPFRLTLRVWDVYLMIGERVLTAMAYNLLKLHRRKLSSIGMDDILHFLQVHLEKKFEVDDDVAMESLARCLEELRKSKLDYAGLPPPHELPKQAFGIFKEPTFEQKVGRRSMEFSNVEKSARESVILRRDTAAAAALVDSPTQEIAPNGHARHSHDETTLPGSKFSLEQSMDDGSSLLGEGSHRSLAETSITSTADLSVFSSAPRSQAADTHSLDTDQGSGPPTPTPRSPDVLRIYVPSPPTNGDITRPPNLDNKIRILVMDQTPQEENTPLVELASPFQPIDLK